MIRLPVDAPSSLPVVCAFWFFKFWREKQCSRKALHGYTNERARNGAQRPRMQMWTSARSVPTCSNACSVPMYPCHPMSVASRAEQTQTPTASKHHRRNFVLKPGCETKQAQGQVGDAFAELNHKKKRHSSYRICFGALQAYASRIRTQHSPE